jgi:hypothetical protein
VRVGDGTIIAKSVKQHSVVKSSTEGEITGTSDTLGDAIHVYRFMECQGYTLRPIKVMQDNTSAIQMFKNGRGLSSKSKHLHIRLFWVSDVMLSGIAESVYCPTGKHIGDGFSKSKTGESWTTFQDSVMGLRGGAHVFYVCTQLKERVLTTGILDLTGSNPHNIVVICSHINDTTKFTETP